MIHHAAAYTGASSASLRSRRHSSSSSDYEEISLPRPKYTPEQIEKFRVMDYVGGVARLKDEALKEARCGLRYGIISRDLSKRFVDLEEKFNAIARDYGEEYFLNIAKSYVINSSRECKRVAKEIRHQLARSKLLKRTREEKGLISMLIKSIGLRFRK